MIIEKAHAKLNLTLDVLDKREDGYYNLVSVMQTLAFCDSITFDPNNSGKITTQSNLPYLPDDERNHAIKAANTFYTALDLIPHGVHMRLHKRIPTNSGLGGGSANAAAVLRGLNRLHGNPLSVDELVALAAKIGSDVPFCIRGGTQLARGRGEVLEPLPPTPFCYVVLCKTGIKRSTGSMFRKLEEWRTGSAGGLTPPLHDNAFLPLLPKAQQLAAQLTELGATRASLSGSGPTVFGLFDNAAQAYTAARALGEKYRDVYVTTTGGSP